MTEEKPVSFRKAWQLLAMVMTGVFLSTLDSGMVNIALPTAMRALGVPFSRAELIVTLYLLTITVTLVFWGQLADRIGRVRIYLSGIVCFAAGGFCCYQFARIFPVLLLGRIVQALGASMMMSSGPAIIKEVFPPGKIGQSLGLVGIATAFGLMAGPVVSGMLLAYFPWNSIFLVSLPVSLFTLFWALKYLQPCYPLPGAAAGQPFDWAGTCCWMSIVAAVMWTIHQPVDRLLKPANCATFIGMVVLLFTFFRIESKVKRPILPLPLIREAYFVVGIVTAAMSFAALFSVLVLVPFYLDYVYKLSAGETGKIMMAVPATLIVVSPASGWLYDRIGARFLTAGGLAICSFALGGLAFLGPTTSLWVIILELAVLGAGQAIFLSPNSASVLSQVEGGYVGMASGILATARNFGMVSGAAYAALAFSWWFEHYAGQSTLDHFSALEIPSFILALRNTFLLAASLPFLGAVLSMLRPGTRLR